MHTHTHGYFTFLCSFIVSFFTPNFIESLKELPFAILQAIILGLLSVFTKDCYQRFKNWNQKRKEQSNG